MMTSFPDYSGPLECFSPYCFKTDNKKSNSVRILLRHREVVTQALLVSAIRAKDADLVKDTGFVAYSIACSVFVPRRLSVQVTLLKRKRRRRLGNFSD